jgi:class 3 adenylate cyclase
MANYVMIPGSGIDKFAFSDNLRGDSVELFRDRHNIESIWSIAIFIDNIERESKERFVHPERSGKDPVEAWFGFGTIRHRQVRNDEELFQYLVRHTLSRSRDLMQIGKALSRLDPEERSPDSVRRTVQEVSIDIVNTYMSEVRPHTTPLDLPRLLRLVDTNALTFEGIGILPDAELFLIHPILNAMIMERNRTYIGDRNKRNIVGDGLLWSLGEPEGAPRRKYCVLKADVCGFSKVMDQGTARTLAVKKKLAEFATPGGLGCEFVTYSQGDAVSIVERDAGRVADAAFKLLDLVKKLGLEVRIALDCGPMTILRGQEGGAGGGEGITGTPFLVAARVEPLVEANQIWCSEAFRKELERGLNIYELVDLLDVVPPGLESRRGEEGFSIGKRGQREIRIRLYRVKRD